VGMTGYGICLDWSECKWSACGPPDATSTPSCLSTLKSRMV